MQFHPKILYPGQLRCETPLWYQLSNSTFTAADPQGGLYITVYRYSVDLEHDQLALLLGNVS
jgi:hypothetical protein